MIDLSSPKGAIAAAALALAKTRPWRDVTLLDIAGAAGISLAGIKEHFASKAEVLGYFITCIDDAVIANPADRSDGETPRDRIFEVVMNRFDLLAPYKEALKAISAETFPDPAQVRAVFNTQHWMLQAAGIPSDGISGGVKIAGLAGIYAAVFRIWLEDDDAGLARTMAALDRRLRRGEKTLQRVNDACSGASDFASSLGRFLRDGAKGFAGKNQEREKTGGPTATGTASTGTPAPAPETSTDPFGSSGAPSGPAT